MIHWNRKWQVCNLAWSSFISDFSVLFQESIKFLIEDCEVACIEIHNTLMGEHFAKIAKIMKFLQSSSGNERKWHNLCIFIFNMVYEAPWKSYSMQVYTIFFKYLKMISNFTLGTPSVEFPLILYDLSLSSNNELLYWLNRLSISFFDLQNKLNN